MLSILECPKDWLHLVKTRCIFSSGAFTVRCFWRRCCTNSIQHSKLIVKFPYPSSVALSRLSFSPVCCLALFFTASLPLKPNSCGVYNAGSLKTEQSQVRRPDHGHIYHRQATGSDSTGCWNKRYQMHWSNRVLNQKPSPMTYYTKWLSIGLDFQIFVPLWDISELLRVSYCGCG